MKKSIFDFSSYIDYLSEALGGASQRGVKAKLARHLGCHTSFISQVLVGKVYLSVEHAMVVSDFLGHSRDERTFFVLLIHKERAGSQGAKIFYQSQIEEYLSRRQLVRENIQVYEELNESHRAIYYSAWWYAAIHVLVAFKSFRTPESIANRLNLSLETVKTSLEFLLEYGLVVQNSDGLAMGKTRIHIGPNTPLVARHHGNWRLKAIDAQERMSPQNLHYSGVIGISLEDAQRVRKLLLNVLRDTEQILVKSKEEQPYVMLIDFFDL